jgi:glycine betaine/proline transport system ATP-binding protein
MNDTINQCERQVKLSCRSVWKVFGPHAERFFANNQTPTTDELREHGLVAANIDASFDVYKGETFVLMGLSGSGKSTLLRCLAQLDTQTSGEILLDGVEISSLSETQLLNVRRKHMSMVFQHFALLPFRSVLENVSFPLEVQAVDKAEVKDRALSALSLVGLSGYEDRLPRELSGGQQQRVGIARSLVSNPEVWFLDEPFSALDPMIRLDLQNEVIDLQNRLHKTTVFVTHDLDEAIRLADRIAIMQDGRIVQIGTPEELIFNPATDYVKRFTSTVPKIKVAHIASIMRSPVDDLDPKKPVVGQKALVADHAELILQSDADLGVIDENQMLIGSVSKDDVIRLMLQ